MKKPSVLRKSVGVVAAFLLGMSWFSPLQTQLRTMPDTLSLTRSQLQALNGGALTATASQDETLGEERQEVVWSFLGVPLKKVTVEVAEDRRLIPGGQALGVAMRTEGVLIVGIGEAAEGVAPAKDAGLIAGDVITRVDGENVTTAESLTALLNQSAGRTVAIAYQRNGEPRTALLTPHRDADTGAVRLGAWVRDSTAGVGTLSFYDPDTGQYAALGHAITDGDTGAVLTVSEGQVLKADIVAVQKGQKGAPGELKGSFLREAERLGDIRRNSILGIYGTLDKAAANPLYPQGLPIGLRSGVHTGAASILSSVDGTGIHEYAIEITRVNQQNAPAPKSMVIRVTDEPAGCHRRHRAGDERQPHHPGRQDRWGGDPCVCERSHAGLWAVCGLDAGGGGRYLTLCSWS